MKKKLGAVLLAGAMACTMAASLGACGGHVQADFGGWPEGGFDVTKPVTITFYHTMGQKLQRVFNTMLLEFNKLYPNITVEHRAPGGWDELRDQIKMELLDNSQPNIAYCYPDHVALYNGYNAVQTLDDFLYGGAFAEEKVHQVKVEGGKQVLDEEGNFVYEEVPFGLTKGNFEAFNPNFYNEGFAFGDYSKMYTLPWSKSTEVMFVNMDLIAEYELEIPETWDDLEKFCEDVKAKNPSLYPFTYDSEANWFITMTEQIGKGEYTSTMGDKFLFDTEDNRAFVTRFAQWYKNGYFTTEVLNGYTYTSGLFTEQKSIICIGSTGGTSYQMDESGETSPFKVGLAPIPQLKPYTETREDYDPNYKSKMISQGPSVCIFKNDDPQKVMASWLFAKFFTTSIDFQARFSAASGYMPVLEREVMETNDVYKDFLTDTESSSALLAAAVDLGMKYAYSYYVSPAFKGSSEARDQVGTIMTTVFVNPNSIDSAFKTALERCRFYS